MDIKDLSWICLLIRIGVILYFGKVFIIADVFFLFVRFFCLRLIKIFLFEKNYEFFYFIVINVVFLFIIFKYNKDLFIL